LASSNEAASVGLLVAGLLADHEACHDADGTHDDMEGAVDEPSSKVVAASLVSSLEEAWKAAGERLQADASSPTSIVTVELNGLAPGGDTSSPLPASLPVAMSGQRPEPELDPLVVQPRATKQSSIGSGVSAVARVGLTNGIGEMRCFLNCILQALWSLASFRTLMCAAEPSVSASSLDCDVLLALLSTFDELDTAAARPAAASGDGKKKVSWAKVVRKDASGLGDATSDAKPVLIDASRVQQALHACEGCWASGKMHDAAEVHEAVINALERVIDDGALRALSIPSVKDTFGLQVQDAGHDECSHLWMRRVLTAEIAQVQPPGSTDALDFCTAGALVLALAKQSDLVTQSSSPSCEPPDGNEPSGGAPQQQAQGLKKKKKKKHTQTNCQSLSHSSGTGAPGTVTALEDAVVPPRSLLSAIGIPLQPRLMTAPHVYTVHLVWDSASPSSKTLERVIDAIVPSLSLEQLHSNSPALGTYPKASKTYKLCAIIGYAASHYVSFCTQSLSENWCLCDDGKLTVLGNLVDVKSRCLVSTFSPTLLFYEDEDA